MKTSLILPVCIIIPVLACKKDKTPAEEREVIKGNGKTPYLNLQTNQHGEAEFNTPVTNKPYTLIKNIAAESISNGF